MNTSEILMCLYCMCPYQVAEKGEKYLYPQCFVFTSEQTATCHPYTIN
jgi:hypothetical protein